MVAACGASARANHQNIAASLEPPRDFRRCYSGDSEGHGGSVPGALPGNTYLVVGQMVQPPRGAARGRSGARARRQQDWRSGPRFGPDRNDTLLERGTFGPPRRACGDRNRHVERGRGSTCRAHHDWFGGGGLGFVQRFVTLTAEQVGDGQNEQGASDDLHQRWDGGGPLRGEQGPRSARARIAEGAVSRYWRRRGRARREFGALRQAMLTRSLGTLASGSALAARALRTGFFGHAWAQSFRASAPPMISISSVVMAA